MPSRKERTQKTISRSKKKEKKTYSSSISSSGTRSETHDLSGSRRLRHEVFASSSPQPLLSADMGDSPASDKEITLRAIPQLEQPQAELKTHKDQYESPLEGTATYNKSPSSLEQSHKSSIKKMSSDASSPRGTDATTVETSTEELMTKNETQDNGASEAKSHEKNSTTEDTFSAVSGLHWLKEQFPQLSEIAQTSWEIWMKEEFDRIPIQNPALRLGVKYGLKKAKNIEKQVLESPVTEKLVLSAFQLGLKAQRAWSDVEKLLKPNSEKKKE